ncbi:MAG: PD-(D/E)XK motif protein [Metamycoplasmataceae bacterium]
MSFVIYKHNNSNDYGIATSRNISSGNIKNLEKYQWIRYANPIKLNDDENIYHSIVFNNLNEEYVKKIKELFEIEYKKDSSLTLEEIVLKLSNAFRKIREKNNLTKYLGLMGELLFIKKCEQIRFDVKDFYSYGSVDVFDFHFNNYDVEIKYGNKENRSFFINFKQLNELRKNNTNELIVVLTHFDTQNGLDLLELYQSIANNDHKNLVVAYELINELQNESNELFLEYKVIPEKSDYVFIDKTYLPSINIKENNCLISAKFKLFISENMERKFEDKIGAIINGR